MKWNFTVPAIVLLLGTATFAQAPTEIGVVFYRDGGGYKPLSKSVATLHTRGDKYQDIKGAVSMIRIPAGPAPEFRVCGVDPTRYKLYVLKSEKKTRTLKMSKTGKLSGVLLPAGQTKSVSQESEIAVTITNPDGNCFAITPKEGLDRGEYGFIPVDTYDVFDFGIGEVKVQKK